MSVRWRQLSPADAPSPRADAQMCLNPNTGKILLFGGYDAPGGPFTRTYLWDTWEWDGSNWTELFPANVPTDDGDNDLYQCDLGWDDINGRFMYTATQGFGLFPNPEYNRFWYYDDVTPDWVEIIPSTVPTGGFFNNNKFTWFPDMGLLVLFTVGPGPSWTWDGTDFTNTGVYGPPIEGESPGQNVEGATFTYDPVRGLVLEYGGDTGALIRWHSTAVYDSSPAWTLETPANNPGDRANAARWAAWQDCLSAVVVYGGAATIDTTNNQTWAYRDLGSGYDWLDLGLSVFPPAAAGNAMVTDAEGRAMLFGGRDEGFGTVFYDETWVLECTGGVQVMRWH